MTFRIGQFRSTATIETSQDKSCDFLTQCVPCSENINTKINNYTFRDWKIGYQNNRGETFQNFEPQHSYYMRIPIQRDATRNMIFNVKLTNDQETDSQFLTQFNTTRIENASNVHPILCVQEGEDTKVYILNRIAPTTADASGPEQNIDGLAVWEYHDENKRYYLHVITTVNYLEDVTQTSAQSTIRLYKNIEDIDNVAYDVDITNEANFNVTWGVFPWENNQSTTEDNISWLEIVFKPWTNNYNYIKIEKLRDEDDYRTTWQEEDGSSQAGAQFQIIEDKIEIFEVTNLIGNQGKIQGANKGLSRIGVWAHPMAMIVINGEKLRVGGNGYFEIAPTEVRITELGLIAYNKQDKFLIDYEYEV